MTFSLCRLSCINQWINGSLYPPHPLFLKRPQAIPQPPPPDTDPDAPSGGDQENDLRYARADVGIQHAAAARDAFISELNKGPLRMSLLKAALHIAAEDDGLATNSTVALPVDAFVHRVEQMVEELARLRLPDAGLTPSTSTPAEVEAVVNAYLFEEKRIKVKQGRSGIPQNTLVDSPGVWERPQYAYVHSTLTNKMGSPASLAILMAHIWSRLLEMGCVSTPVRIDCRYFHQSPRFEPLTNLTVDSLRIKGTDQLANTCTTDALIEILRILKRSYFPYRWNTSFDSTTEFSGGGFLDAASRLLTTTEMALDAMARAAEYRLQRGIFTSTGAGDLRRCVAAAERLVLICGDERPFERRDLGVLYMHLGFFDRAQAELKAYRASDHFAYMQSRQEQKATDDLLAKLPYLIEAALESEQVGYGSGFGAEGSRAPLSLERPDSVLFHAHHRGKLSIHW